jgi:hypothetical protein
MSRAAVYAAIAAILAGLFIGVDAFVTTFFANSRLQTAISLAAVAGTALLFGRLHGHLVALVDGALFPRRREKLQRLKHVREQLDDEHDVTAIERLLNGGVCEALGLASSALFVSSGDGGFVRDISVGWERGTMWHALRDDPIVATLGNGGSAALRLDDDAWLEAAIPHGAARPALVIPLRFRRRTCALQFYGAHVTGGDLDPAEIKGLKELCAGVAPVFANASQ